ncbi:MAG: ABC transporter permease [Lachnospiraceae bacterium]|nr:ABC transporter permease [Lachnospiraceae bacterium]
MKNNNGASIRKLSKRSLKNNRVRNIFAVAAITLTGILFTAVFSLVGGAMQAAQESTMREVGGRFHAGLKGATKEQYEKVAADPMVVKSSYNIFIGTADNIVKWSAEIRYLPEEETLHDMFIELEEGQLPTAENEIVVNTFVFDELNLPYALGEKIPLTFRFMDETIEDEFVVSGWYRGDYVAHASELFVSKSYWEKLKGSLTDEDFLRWREAHPEDRDVGLYAGNVYFDNASNLDEKMRTVIINAGYEPETELDYGVNWAYMSSRVEAADPFAVMIVLSAVLVILITGYLIIYNIFQISVISDIRFYGLLKTIGTTKRQLRRLVRRQALLLSVIGIPIGLALGYGIGKYALPLVLSLADYNGADDSLRFNPWILLFSVAFSLLTVFLSSLKPAKIAGSISPIEAVKYTEAGLQGKPAGRKKKRHASRKRFSAVSMALSNLGRNKRTTVVVIMAISFSMILMSIIMTAVRSFRIEQFMEQRITGDFMLGNINLTSSSVSNLDVEIAPEYLELADAQSGIEKRQEMWVRFRTTLQVDEKAREELHKLDAEGKLKRDRYSEELLDKLLRGERPMNGYCYGYSEDLLSKLQVLEGTLDIEKFRSGDYVLLGQMHGVDWLPPEDHVYHPGDTVTLEMYTENSTFREITNEAGETIEVVYENLEEKEYEVMAIVDIPTCMDLHIYPWNACEVVLPFTEMKAETTGYGNDEETVRCWQKFMVSYEISDEEQTAFEAAVKSYADSHSTVGYLTKENLRKEFDDMVTVIATVGVFLAAVIALIGILNFVNAIVTGIISRRREFAMLQSIGMTDEQLQKTLVCEGTAYIAISGMISLVVGSVLSYLIVNALNHMILFFEYRFQSWSFIIMIPILLLVAVFTPMAAYKNLRKKSIVERLRD